MNVRCELMDYSERENYLDKSRVVVTDAGTEPEMVIIQLAEGNFGYRKVKVSGQELIEAVQRCMKAQWPY